MATDRATPLWFSESGRGETLVVLHPGGVDSRSMDALVDALGDGYRTIRPDQRGHGRTPDADGPLSFHAMAADTIAVIASTGGGPVHLLGHSDGAIVALHVALSRPDLVRSVVFGAGVFHHGGWTPGILDGEPPEFLGDTYAEVSPDGRGHWPAIVSKLAELHATAPALTTTDVAALRMPVLVIVGDDDEPRLEHVLELYRALPDGELAVIPRATHGFIVEKPDLVARIVRGFHSTEKTNGFAPIRRASAD